MEETGSDEQANDRKRQGTRWGLGCLGALVLTVGGCVALTVAGGSNEEGRDAAWRSCQTAIKAQLANPGTADFSYLGSTLTKASDGTWSVLGPVKAKTGFGVEQELEFTCETTPLGTTVTRADVRPVG